MNKLLTGVLATSLLSATLLADIFVDGDYKNELNKMDKYLNSLVKSHLNASSYSNLVYPRVNMQNREEDYLYEFDLAGIDKKNIKLTIDERNILTLSGNTTEKSQTKKKKYETQEIFFGSFKRVLQLPKDINQSKIESNYENGILILTIGKKELIKPKSKIIPIN